MTHFKSNKLQHNSDNVWGESEEWLRRNSKRKREYTEPLCTSNRRKALLSLTWFLLKSTRIIAVNHWQKGEVNFSDNIFMLIWPKSWLTFYQTVVYLLTGVNLSLNSKIYGSTILRQRNITVFTTISNNI